MGSLRLGTIKKTDSYVIYSVPDSGAVKSHISIFKKGTPAFVDGRGNPILRVKCGNPFVRGPVKAYALGGGSPVSEESQDYKPSFAADNTPPAAVPTGSTLVATVPTLTPIEESVTDGIPQALKTVPAIIPEAAIGQSFALSTGTSLGALGAIGAIGAIGSISGNPGSNPEPVPEPLSILTLGVGLAAIAKRKRK